MKRFAINLTVNTTAVLGLFGGMYLSTLSQPVIQQENPAGVVECWNPHTAQITIVDGDTCPEPVNPYAAN